MLKTYSNAKIELREKEFEAKNEWYFFRRKAHYIGNSMCKYNVIRRIIIE
jgi:hypothetical protein